jgi:hypothetical protein
VATKSHWRSLFAKMQQRLSRRIYVISLARLGKRRMHVSPAVESTVNILRDSPWIDLFAVAISQIRIEHLLVSNHGQKALLAGKNLFNSSHLRHGA